MKVISLFSGIGGFELAAQWMGWTPVVSCEINDFGNKVLSHYWPEAYHHRDVKTLTYEKINKEVSERFGKDWKADGTILVGGFPCQPYSSAGLRKGKEDDRHLWPEMLRVIKETSPDWIVGENVRGILNWNGGLVFREVIADMEAEGYEVAAFLLPACSVNAPHKRDRVWFVAHANRSDDGRKPRENDREEVEERIQERKSFIPDKIFIAADPDNKGCEGSEQHRTPDEGNGTCKPCRAASKPDSPCSPQIPTWDTFPNESPILSGDDGLPSGLDGITFPKWRNESIKAFGNAVVPQLVLQIFKAIERYESAD
jgi:DNA (cytosine-5)-methyltransferase 1